MWNVIFPISNLKLDGIKSLHIGNACFKNLSKNFFKSDKLVTQKTIDLFLNNVCCVIKVNETDKTKAKEIGLETCKEALNILRFFSPFLFSNVHKAHIGIVGYLLCSYTEFLAYSGKTRIGSISRTGYLFPYKIDKKNYNTMKKIGLFKINKMLQSNNRTKFQDRLLRAIQWFGKGVEDSDKSDKFIKYAISLEILLIHDSNEPKSSNISERSAFIVHSKKKQNSQTTGYRKYINKIAKRLYNQRSEIVHSGLKEPSDDELNKLEYLTKICMFELIKKYEKFKSIDELIEWVEDIKFN